MHPQAPQPTMPTLGTATLFRLENCGDWGGLLYCGCFYRKGEGVGYA